MFKFVIASLCSSVVISFDHNLVSHNLQRPNENLERDLECETCQLTVYDSAKRLKAIKAKDSLGYIQLDAIQVIETQCDIENYRLYGERSLIKGKKLVDQCLDMMFHLSEDLEDLLPVEPDETKLRETICPKYCKKTGLWKETDLPHLRMSLTEYHTKVGELFLEENKKQNDVDVTDSGLQYKIVRNGLGTHKPSPSSVVRVHYEGKKMDGTIFETTKGKGPNRFSPMDVIDGWNQALQMMTVGQKMEIAIPPAIGYGEFGNGNGSVEGGEVLLFEVHLLEIIGVESEEDFPDFFKLEL